MAYSIRTFSWPAYLSFACPTLVQWTVHNTTVESETVGTSLHCSTLAACLLSTVSMLFHPTPPSSPAYPAMTAPQVLSEGSLQPIDHLTLEVLHILRDRGTHITHGGTHITHRGTHITHGGTHITHDTEKSLVSPMYVAITNGPTLARQQTTTSHCWLISMEQLFH